MSDRTEYFSNWRKERKRKGLCCICDNPVAMGQTSRCLECIEKNKQDARERRERHAANGLCVRGDGNPIQEGYRLCTPCIAAQGLKQKQEYIDLKHQIVIGYGGQCLCCGETIEMFLTLDHKFNDGARERKPSNYNILQLYRRIIREQFPPQYQLMCWNCNCGRYRNGGICPHKKEHV